MATDPSPPFFTSVQHVQGALGPVLQNPHTPTWQDQTVKQVTNADSLCMENTAGRSSAYQLSPPLVVKFSTESLQEKSHKETQLLFICPGILLIFLSNQTS